ncbi:MAG: 2TM domain-containing protein [Flavobacteriaceae bacterium]|nr:MAG: 2TM domain-containing protein [Flavobacteriaceae bacterium]
MEVDKNKLNEEYLRASARLDELKGFYSNIVAYVLVIPFLIFVNYMTYWDFKWFWFPMIGWGIGVAIHAVVTFVIGKDWERRKIKELMDNDKFK